MKGSEGIWTGEVEAASWTVEATETGLETWMEAGVEETATGDDTMILGVCNIRETSR